MVENRRRLIYGLLWIAFANGVIAALISVQAILSISLPESGLGMTYLLLQQVGHFQFLAWLLSLPLLIIALLLPMRALIRCLAFVVFTAFILLVYADYEIYQLYRFHFNSMVWNLLVGGAAQEILILEFDSLITFGGIAAIALLTENMKLPPESKSLSKPMIRIRFSHCYFSMYPMPMFIRRKMLGSSQHRNRLII